VDGGHVVREGLETAALRPDLVHVTGGGVAVEVQVVPVWTGHGIQPTLSAESGS